MKRVIPPKIKTKWLEIWHYYQNIKKIYNLTSYDILTQLNAPCYITYREYLSIHGKERVPATRQGTVGIKMWEILIPGLKKNDWLPSISGYKEKLEENKCNGMYYNYDFHINYENNIPVINVCIHHEEYYNPNNIIKNPSKDTLSEFFTIDGIVPVINEISNSYWL